MTDAIDRIEFDRYEDTRGEFRWRLIAGNGEIVADSAQGYDNERDRDGMIAKITEALHRMFLVSKFPEADRAEERIVVFDQEKGEDVAR